MITDAWVVPLSDLAALEVSSIFYNTAECLEDNLWRPLVS